MLSFSCKQEKNNIYEYINKFLKDEFTYSSDENLVNDFKNKFKGDTIEIEGNIWVVYPMQLGITIKENQEKKIIVTAFCKIENAKILFKVNQIGKINGTIEDIIISSDPDGTRILNFQLTNCNKID